LKKRKIAETASAATAIDARVLILLDIVMRRI